MPPESGEMKTIIVNTQSDWDKLPSVFKEWSRVEVIGALQKIKSSPDNCEVIISGSAKIGYVSDSAKIGSVSGSAKIDCVYGSAKIDYVSGKSIVEIHSANVSIDIVGLFAIVILWGVKATIGKVAKSATVLAKKLVPVTNKMLCESLLKRKNLIIFYKSVNPDTLCDFYTGRIKYELGKEITCPDWDSSTNRECGGGLHVSPTPHDALKYNQGKILCVGVALNDFVIFQGNLSKVRAKKVFVFGEHQLDAA